MSETSSDYRVQEGSTRPPEYDWNRILSALLVLGWLGLLGVAGGAESVAKGLIATVLPLACVWFPDELGALTTSLPGPLSMQPITQSSPGCLVRVLGWVVLLALIVLPMIA
jgi:hypothetical protein